MTDNWIIFAHPTDGSGEEAYQLLTKRGITPYEFMIYNGTRSILSAMGINTDTSQIFYGFYYFGTIEDLRKYFEDEDSNNAD